MSNHELQTGILQQVAGRISTLVGLDYEADVSDTAPVIEVSLQALEERVLYSASPVPVDLMSQVDAIDATIVEADLSLFETIQIDETIQFDSAGVDPNAFLLPDEVSGADWQSWPDANDVLTLDGDDPPLTRGLEEASLRNELVVVDLGVDGYQQLVDDLLQQQEGNRTFDIIYLDKNSSGVESLRQQLSSRVSSGADLYHAMHVVSHGSDGTIHLGTDRLSFESLDRFAVAVSGWGEALTDEADLLIYGCDVASTESGREFIDSLAELTKADVSSSDDITGHRSQGGDWDFEYSVGVIETELAFSRTVQRGWDHSLVEITASRESGGQSNALGIDGEGRRITVISGEEVGVTDGQDVFMRTRDQFGAETEVIVNETLAGDQIYASVAVAENGTKAVTWTSINTAGERAVYAKFYDADGNVTRGEFRVDVPTTGVEADDSSIAIDAAGNVVIVWESVDGSGDSEVLGRRYTVDGNPAGAVFNVSGSGQPELDESANAQVAMNDAGQFVVVWDTFTGDSADISRIYARTFQADGTANIGTLLIQNNEDHQYTQASVDIDSSGGFVVAFTLNDLDDGSNGLQVRAESKTFDGVHIAAYSGFVDDQGGDQFATSVSLLDNGNALIAWEGDGIDQFGSPDPQETYAAVVESDTGNVVVAQDSLSTSGSPQRFWFRTNASTTTVGDSAFATSYVTKLFGSDLVVNNGVPSSSNNQSPTGTDRTFSMAEDGSQSITISDFGFSDADGGTFTHVQISKLPEHGRILLDGAEVSSGDIVLESELTAHGLIYLPDSDFSGQDELLFFVHDGTGYAGSYSTFTFEVEPVVDGATASWGTGFTSVTGGLPVNTTIEGNQDRPDVAALAGGGYVVVWESADQDFAVDSDGDGNFNDGQQVYFQLYDSSNNKVGSEVLVGDHLLGDQSRPSVIGLADGGFVIAASTGEIGMGEQDVYAQLYDNAGNLVSGPVGPSGVIELAQHTNFGQGFVSLTALRDGGFVASWSTLDGTLESDPSYASVARVFDADGNGGGEFLLNEADAAPDSSGQFVPQVTELKNGSLAATWYDTLLDRVMFRVFDGSGTPLTAEQVVSDSGSGLPEFGSKIASLGDNGFVIIWTENGANVNSEVIGRQFDLDGNPIPGSEKVISPGYSTFDFLPDVVSLEGEGFVALWDGIGLDENVRGVAAMRFDANFNQLSDEFVVNSQQFGMQGRPAGALLANGDLIVAYEGNDGDNGGLAYETGVFVERLSPSVTVDEDTDVLIGLKLSTGVDLDGSESVQQIQISGLPIGSVLSDGTVTVNITSGSQIVDVDGAGLTIENLVLTPPEHFYGEFLIEAEITVEDTSLTSSEIATEHRFLLVNVQPVNDVASYDVVDPTVTENGTTQIDLDSFFGADDDPDDAAIQPTISPETGYQLDPTSPPLVNAGFYEWTSTSGASGTITIDASHASFEPNPDSDFPGISAGFDFDGMATASLTTSGSRSIELWFQPDNVAAQQTLLEFGDATAGWGVYLNAGMVEFHFRSATAPANVTPHVLIGGTISSTEFNQVIVTLSPDGSLAGDSTQPDVALFVNGELVDSMTDVQTLGDPNSLVGTASGSLGSTNGAFLHASATTYDGFDGLIAELNLFDQAIGELEAQHRYFDIAHGAHIVQVDGQSVEVGVATTLSSGATVTYNGDGTITYDPNGQFEHLDEYDAGNSDSFHQDDFDIMVSDGQGDVQTLTVQMTVEGENDAPSLSIIDATPAPTTASLAGTWVGTAAGDDIDLGGPSGLMYSLTGTVTGAFAIDSSNGEITIADESIYQNPPGGMPHVIEVTVTDAAGESDTVSYNVPIIVLPTGQVTGTVYEDVVGDGSIAGDQGVDGVEVHLYRDNGDGLRDASDEYVATVTTSGGGNYVFQGPLITYGDYYVTVDSKDINPSNGFNDSLGVNDVWAEQTYGSAGALYLDAFGTETVSLGGALFGGYSGTLSDDASSLATAEHVSQVSVTNSSDGTADFGFSFNVVTNTLAGDDQDDDVSATQRTVQGSLRQFIDNSNAIDNSDGSDIDNAMRFVARNAANSSDGTWWSIVISEVLPSIRDSHTIIDGTVYAADGFTILDPRPIVSTVPNPVGANDDYIFTGFDQPELEVIADLSLTGFDRIMHGLVVEANDDQTVLTDVEISNLSIHGFGSTSGTGANVYITGGGIDQTSTYLIEDIVIQNNFIGIAPDESVHSPTYRTHGIQVYRANDGIIRDNLIGHHGLSGIHFTTSAADAGSSVASGWEILRNKITHSGDAGNQYGGLGLGNSIGTEVQHNLITDSVGFGIDSYFAVGGFEISENTITRSGSGGFDRGGIRLFGSGSVVSGNRIIDNFGNGITLVGTAERSGFFQFAASGNELTENQFGENGGIDVDLMASLTAGQSFDDLDSNNSNSLDSIEVVGTGLSLAAHDLNTSGSISRSEYNSAQAQFTGQGDGVSPVDGANTHSGNDGLDRAVIQSVSSYPDRLELTVQLASGVDRIELYEITSSGGDERVTFVRNIQTSEMAYDSGSDFYSITISPKPNVSNSLTVLAFAGSNTAEFSGRYEANTPPTATDQTLTTAEDITLDFSAAIFDAAFSDTDAGDTLQQVRIRRIGANGQLIFQGTEVPLNTFVEVDRADLDQLQFEPVANESGVGYSTLEFFVSDGDAYSEVAREITIDVTPVNDLPSGENNTVTTNEDTAKSLQQSDFGFTDVEDQLNVIQGAINLNSVTGGKLQLGGIDVSVPTSLSRSDLDNLTFVPTQDLDTAGFVEFTVFDSEGATDGVTYTLTIGITPENDLPTIDSSLSFTLDEDSTLVIDNFGAQLAATGDDVDGDPLNNISIATGDFPTGVFIYDEVLDRLTVTPPHNSNGTVQLGYTLQFGDDFVSSSVVFHVTPTNDPPVTVSDQVTIAEDTPVNLSAHFGNLLSNDSDPEGDVLHVDPSSFSPPIFGTLSTDSTSGDLIYTPNPNSSHTEVLTYDVSDGVETTQSTLTIIVDAENDAPVLTVPAMVMVTENTQTIGAPIVTDLEDGTAPWFIVGGPDASAFFNDGGTLKFIGPPDYETARDHDENNVYRVMLGAVDSDGANSETQLVRVRVTDVNEAPSVLSQSIAALVRNVDGQLVGSVNLNAIVSDVDAGDSLSFSVTHQTAHGFVSVGSDGTFIYNPIEQAPGQQDSFSFVATDSGGLNSPEVNVVVNVINGAILPDSEDDTEPTDDSTDEPTDPENDSTNPVGVTGPSEEDEEKDIIPGALLPSVAPTDGSDISTKINGFNDFGAFENQDFAIDDSTSQIARTYAYSLNHDVVNVVTQLSIDRAVRRAVHVIEFDVDVLASAFLEELDTSKQQYLFNRFDVGTPEIAASAATLLTMSYLVWNMASGILLSTFMSSLPAWSSFDVLPVIAGFEKDGDDESIEQMVDA